MKAQDLAAIDYESEFANEIRKIFFDYHPKKIIETGLHHGNGSTRIITSLIKYIPLTGATFYSIECNPESIKIAKENLGRDDLLPHVTIMSGLSVPVTKLPSKEGIEEHIKISGNVKCDHSPDTAAENYGKEVIKFESEDCLGKAFEKFEYAPDFVLLDSAGHLGWEEFFYVTSMLKGKCFVALDDIYHVKHSKSYKCIKNSPNFKIIAEGKEKFGYAIVEITP